MLKTVASAVVIIVFGGYVSGCMEPVSQEGARCSITHPCSDNLSCSAGSCKKLIGAPLTCKGDSDCTLPSGKVLKCLDNKFCVSCIPGAGGCMPGDYCTSDFFCVDCLVDQHCATNRCVNNVCRSCNSNLQCASGQCDNGVCNEI